MQHQPRGDIGCVNRAVGRATSNLGIDFKLFNSRLAGALDIYKKSGKKLYGTSPIDYTGAPVTSIIKNVASIRGTGMDLELNSINVNKKYIFLICHSFQVVCRKYGIGLVSKRRKPAFGVFPVHVTHEGQQDRVLFGLNDPFYVVDSREYQVTTPDFETINSMGSKILCIEKYRPHVPYEQAIMGMRFNEYMLGMQFHPEADAAGMSMYLQTEEKKQTVIESHGEEKWRSMVEQLNDPDKITWTYAHIIPNFLRLAYQQLHEQLVEK